MICAGCGGTGWRTALAPDGERRASRCPCRDQQPIPNVGPLLSRRRAGPPAALPVPALRPPGDAGDPEPGQSQLPIPPVLPLLEHVPGFRPSPARTRGPDGRWRAVHVDSAHAACMERVSGRRRGPYSDLTSAMHRRRLKHGRARLPERARIVGVACKYGLPVKVVSKMARQTARDIPPSASRAGLREIQRARGLMSGAARRAGCYVRDRESVALLDQPGATVRAVAAQQGVSVRAVVSARDRLARTCSPDERLWREGRRVSRRAVKGFWRAHYRTCVNPDCTCTDRQTRNPEGLSPDGRPWQFPRRAEGYRQPEIRARKPAPSASVGRTDPQTNLSQSEITTLDGASAGAAGLHDAPVLQPGEGYERLKATVERLRQARRGRRRRDPPG